MPILSPISRRTPSISSFLLFSLLIFPPSAFFSPFQSLTTKPSTVPDSKSKKVVIPDSESSSGSSALSSPADQRVGIFELFGDRRPSPTCPAFCCKRVLDWAYFYDDLDFYNHCPFPEGFLNTYAWDPVRGGILSLARQLQMGGLLARWDELQPMAKEKMLRWSPVAREFWESDFPEHRQAVVQAWIWHYLNDNLFAIAADVQSADLFPCSSPVWEHVRALRQKLDGRSKCGFALSFYLPRPTGAHLSLCSGANNRFRSRV